MFLFWKQKWKVFYFEKLLIVEFLVYKREVKFLIGEESQIPEKFSMQQAAVNE